MAEITMKATRSFYAGGIGRVGAGENFSATESRAGELERAGLAERSGAKSDPAPQNKMEPPVENKADEGPRRRTRKVKEDSDDAVP